MSINEDNPITSGKLQQIVDLHRSNLGAILPKPAGPPKLSPSEVKPAAELAQDPGGAYNSNHVFPQK